MPSLVRLPVLKKNFARWDREEKGWFCPTIFQLFEQKNISLENSQLTKSHNLPALDACLARD